MDKVALGQVSSEYFGFPCQFSFHRLLHIHHHLSSGAVTIGQLVADVPSGLSLTPPQETKKTTYLTGQTSLYTVTRNTSNATVQIKLKSQVTSTPTHKQLRAIYSMLIGYKYYFTFKKVTKLTLMFTVETCLLWTNSHVSNSVCGKVSIYEFLLFATHHRSENISLFQRDSKR
jgi:hypothetical protein